MMQLKKKIFSYFVLLLTILFCVESDALLPESVTTANCHPNRRLEKQNLNLPMSTGRNSQALVQTMPLLVEQRRSSSDTEDTFIYHPSEKSVQQPPPLEQPMRHRPPPRNPTKDKRTRRATYNRSTYDDHIPDTISKADSDPLAVSPLCLFQTDDPQETYLNPQLNKGKGTQKSSHRGRRVSCPEFDDPSSPLRLEKDTQGCTGNKYFPPGSDEDMESDQYSRKEGNRPEFRGVFPRPVVARQNVKIILSIDGGGIRGIIPLVYLVTIKNALNVESLNGFIDVLAGTSVGSLLDMIVSRGNEQAVFNNFTAYLKRIFTKKTTLNPLKASPYKSRQKLKVIENFTKNSSGQQLFSHQLLPTLWIVTFYNLLTEENIAFVNDNAYETFYVRDLLMMSSAAPTFFKLHSCQSFHRNDTTLPRQGYLGADGGLFANNPANYAYIEIRRRYPNDKIIVISLGTGQCNVFRTSEHYTGKNLLGWAEYFPNLMISSTSSTAEYMLDNLASMSSGMLEHIRIQPSLPEDLMTTDGIDKLSQLTNLAHASISLTGSEHAKMERVIEIFREVISMRGIDNRL
ncbi:MAG: patatin-like phospholipase family protein [Holosporaceae bacterium]|jgi:predicted acylesterase/phospholipase RssA|nr:patatin-like phospholipase family protein [Holosporaceae bacterium]